MRRMRHLVLGALRARRALPVPGPAQLASAQRCRRFSDSRPGKDKGTGDADAASLTLFEGSVRRPGETADVATVIRNWWAYPAVGFGASLELPVQKFEVLDAEKTELGSVVVPNSIFGLPIRKDLIFKAYWYHRRKLAGYQDTMQLYKWEWPGANRKVRSQKASGKGRMGRRKAPGKFEGSHCHALRPRDWGQRKMNARVLWQAVRCMLSVKFVQNSIKVVDSFNLQSHKTKHLVQHLRRLLGRRCHSALLVHEGHVDVNDNCRWASAHVPAIRRENVEGLSVYNLLKYHQVVITEAALTKLLKEIFLFPRRRAWTQRFATPDQRPAPVPSKVPGWNRAWVEKKERLRNSEFRAREFFQESLKWKWSSELKGPLKVPRTDALSGFRVKDFLLSPEAPAWEKLESLYGDEEPLEEDLDDEEFSELVDNLDALRSRGEARADALERSDVAEKGLRQLAAALQQKQKG